ncbi:Biopolymer transport protein ExbD [Dickeya dianthicola]|uniref:Biopolymer transporter ExbD n=1 Tax=Dickeya dianthicola TaxID=204039 RepID=A0AAP6S0G5_9GAMM|nr:biopolymer transporter ExbD [Dickeya dianthicola]ATO32481.1 Biopolymer transport protein ExbD/TolR [Dickeya dianthicola RNS04.9]AYC18496.1 Biopolymer transport protein ExbD [Dickeya dianthicola]MBI0438757.1 biopolymer transporter ExbD [Dickeya dianthicola]MBI0451508.1 biopolymer transporter ExbD [Dickeya dianthicola]MBI0455907.1 biopolymer transporter ExbD [Dickeya dianthicola]
MAFASRDNDEVMSEMNITPLVDVMLVLLVVFIVTAPMLTNSIPIRLPKTAAVAPADSPRPLVISLDASQQLFIDKEALPREALTARLQQAKTANPELVVQVQAEDAANYGAVAALLADLEKAGISRLSLLTRK